MTKHNKNNRQQLTAPDPNKPQGRGNPPTKTDTLTRDNRVNTIMEMILQGARTSQMNAFLAARETWHPGNPTPDPSKVSTRTVENYIRLAKQRIIETAAKKRDYLLAKSLEQMDDLYQKSYKLQDFKNCRQIIRDRNELTGLLRIEAKITKTTHNIDYSKYTAKELKELLQTAQGGQTEDFEDIDHEDMPDA